MSGHVEELCRKVWLARKEGTLTRDDVLLSQQLYVAAACDIAERRDVLYDPETDRKVEWLREVIAGIRSRRSGLRKTTDATLEALVEWLVFGPAKHEPSGKEMAAGVS